MLPSVNITQLWNTAEDTSSENQVAQPTQKCRAWSPYQPRKCLTPCASPTTVWPRQPWQCTNFCKSVSSCQAAFPTYWPKHPNGQWFRMLTWGALTSRGRSWLLEMRSRLSSISSKKRHTRTILACRHWWWNMQRAGGFTITYFRRNSLRRRGEGSTSVSVFPRNYLYSVVSLKCCDAK